MVGLFEKVKLWNDSSPSQEGPKAEEELEAREMLAAEETDDAWMGGFILRRHSLTRRFVVGLKCRFQCATRSQL